MIGSVHPAIADPIEEAAKRGAGHKERWFGDKNCYSDRHRQILMR